MSILSSLLAGLIFGIGLIVSGMSNPAKVIGFLDLAGNWDPSLAFVMGGAITIGVITFLYVKRRSASLLGKPLHIPSLKQIDARLIGGSALFGIGWGVAGICPGPGLVLLGSGLAEGVVFVAAMIAGMLVFEWQQGRTRTTAAHPAHPQPR